MAAYHTGARPPVYTNRSPSEQERRQQPPSYHWPAPSQSTYQPVPPPLLSSQSLLDPESEDSDVSVTPGTPSSSFAIPQSLPPPPSRQALELSENVQQHLTELERVEEFNIRKHKLLKEKRARKDDKIARKRAAQDEKIKAIMTARERRDNRLRKRRDREDTMFQRFYDDLEEEENRLRRVLKRLKRGLPADDANLAGGSVSTASMSPPGPSYSIIPPPAKRHQSGPPGHADPNTDSRARENPAYPPTAPTSSYQFYQAPPPQQQAPPQPYAAPYHPSPTLPSNSHPINSPASHYRTPSSNHAGSPSLGSNAANASPNLSRPSPFPQHLHLNPPLPEHTPRQTSANYDTRPPPPNVSSGFATVNPPPQSGFTSVNSRPLEHSTTPSSTDVKQPGQTAVDHTPSRPHGGDGTSQHGTPASNSANKRTPSTTHPYQMSEAFANRHHHCERVDDLSRGIWTWYGHGGTRDRPTREPVEMYLKCNHDNCGRIDWRTVHGLQCHIVKNHEQPKGTIGSLERALDRYGVPVKEIEEIERREGIGAGGTMADPKHVRVRAKTRESSEKRTIGEENTVPYRMHQANDGPDSTAFTAGSGKSRPGHKIGDLLESRPPTNTNGVSHVVHPQHEAKPTGGFAAVNSSWTGVNSPTHGRPSSRDQHMPDAPPMKSPSDQAPAPTQAPFWQTWRTPDDQNGAISQTSAAQAPPSQGPAQTVPNGGPVVAEPDRAAPATGPTPASTSSSQAQSNGEQNKEAEIMVEKETEKEKDDVSLAASTTNVQGKESTAPQTNTEDTPMSGIEKAEVNGDGETRPAHSRQQSKASSTAPEKLDKEPKVAVVEVTSRATPERTAADTELGQPSTPGLKVETAKSAIQSPEVAQKRGFGPGTASRRGSRRSSTAAAMRAVEEEHKTSPATSERTKEEDNEDDDDDGDNIIVATSPRPTERKGFERTKPETRRQSNGRFVRSGRRFGATT